MTAVVVDSTLARVADGERGELCMRGPQVSAGYWHDAERTDAAFVRMPGTKGSTIAGTTQLPVYMVPQTVLFRDELPLNDNGKIDRKRLMDELARPR